MKVKRFPLEPIDSIERSIGKARRVVDKRPKA